jgi:hypothetical protein
MKKKKLQLKELKVKSFITNLEMNEAKGGVRLKGDEQEGRSMIGYLDSPWNIRVHTWTISEIRNDGMPHQIND